MAISSNSLFHFTNSLNDIKKIFKTGFQPSYCMESNNMAYPMISFCDIPLSQAKNHFEQYGKYVIGLKKEWGVKSKLNPVFYLSENSYIESQIYNAITLCNKLSDDDDITPIQSKIFELKSLPGDILRFSKPYEGALVRKGETFDDYKFYNEREWRFVPEMEFDGIKPALYVKEYEKFKKKNPKKPHITNISLKFKPEDIQYIIVENESDITKILKFLSEIDGWSSHKKIQLLFTKILTSTQIYQDM